MDLKQIEKKILNDVEPLRIRGLLKKRAESPAQFLVKFFTKWNEDKQTVFAKTVMTNEQTSPGRRRSLGDLYMIMKHYYPKLTLKELIKILHVDLKGGQVPRFRSSVCGMIKKRVFYQGVDSSSSKFVDGKDEFENYLEDYTDIIE